MTNIVTILYTMEPQFEQFLTGTELQTMSLVSHATRSGVLAIRFRNILQHVKQEYKICKANNSYSNFYINDFLKEYPLRTIFKNYAITNVDRYNLIEFLLQVKAIDYVTSIFMKIEIGDLYNEEFKSMICDIKAICNDPKDDLIYNGGTDDAINAFEQYPAALVELCYYNDFNLSYIYLEFMPMICKRLNACLVEYLYQDQDINFNFHDMERDYYYPITKELRDVYIKYEPELAHLHVYYINKTGMDIEDDMFGLVNTRWERCEIFSHTLEYALECLDWNLFKAYMEKHNKLIKYEELFQLEWKRRKQRYMERDIIHFTWKNIPEKQQMLVKFVKQMSIENYDYSYVMSFVADRLNTSVNDLERAYAYHELGIPYTFEQLFKDYESKHKYTQPKSIIAMGVELA